MPKIIYPEYVPRPQAEGSIFKTEVTVFHYTDLPKPVNNLFIFFLSLKRLCLLTGKKLTQALLWP